MRLDNGSNSIVKMERMYFSNIEFQRSKKEIHKASLRLGFEKSYKFNENHKGCTVEFTCIINDEVNDSINVKATIVGVFSCEEESEEKRNTLLTKNTIAILFPYLRSQISLITAQPDLTPIVIPPINVEALFNNDEES